MFMFTHLMRDRVRSRNHILSRKKEREVSEANYMIGIKRPKATITQTFENSPRQSCWEV